MKWTFGDFELDADRYRLRRRDEVLHVEPRVLETLAWLVSHRERVVSRQELVEHVWCGVVVSDATLKRAIQEARRVLGDDGDRQQLIQTVYGRGYRFVGDVRTEEGAAPAGSHDRGGRGGGRERSRALESAGRRSLVRVLAAVASALTVLGIAHALFAPTRRDRPSPEEGQPLRLLVLPFEPVGPAEHAWFAAGLTDELTTRLASVRGIAVISGTTARHYASDERSLAAIGQEADVDYVLEGAVRYDAGGDAPPARVTSQLIRVEDDVHVWVGSFDRRLDDVLGVQAEIAAAVAQRLDVGVDELAEGPLASPSTQDVEAFRSYVTGSELLSQGRAPGAVDLLQRAVAGDPGFASAWARLAMAHSLFLLAGTDTSHERREAARGALARAAELAPSHPEVRIARALYAWRVAVDYDAGLREIDSLLEETPHRPRGLLVKHALLARLGRFAEAREVGERAVRLEGLPGLLYEIGIDAWATGEHEEAERYFDRAIARAPDQLSGYLAKAWHQLAWKGDLEGARAILETMPDVDEPPPGFATFAWWPVLLAERRYDEALERLAATPVPVLWNQWTHWPKPLLRAQVYRLEGEDGLARIELEGVLPALEALVKARSPNVLARSRHHGALGLALAGLSRREEAVRHGERAVALGGVETDALVGPWRLEELAEIYLLIGDRERAAETLEQLVSLPCRVSPAWLRLDPRWDALRGHPRFERLVTSPGSPDRASAADEPSRDRPPARGRGEARPTMATSSPAVSTIQSRYAETRMSKPRVPQES